LLARDGEAIYFQAGSEIQREAANFEILIPANGSVIFADGGIVFCDVGKQTGLLIVKEAARDDQSGNGSLLNGEIGEIADGEGFGRVVILRGALHNDYFPIGFHDELDGKIVGSACGDDNLISVKILKTAGSDFEAVSANGKSCENEFAGSGAERGLNLMGQFVCRVDLSAGDYGTGGIGDRSLESSRWVLGRATIRAQ